MSNEEIKDALEFLKHELQTIQALAVRARDRDEFESSRSGLAGRDPRTVTYFALAALTTIVIDQEQRLALVESELSNLKRLEADGK